MVGLSAFTGGFHNIKSDIPANVGMIGRRAGRSGELGTIGKGPIEGSKNEEGGKPRNRDPTTSE
jgi:hypothetical protein